MRDDSTAMAEHELGVMSVDLPIVLRLATENDLAKLEWYGQYQHYRNLFRRAFREQRMGRRLMLLADCNGYPIGQIFMQLRSAKRSLFGAEDSAYLYALRVMEMFRGQGIGTRLIQQAEVLSLEHDCTWATIAVAKENSSARRLYERLGYRVYGDDLGRWSYIDHKNRVRQVNEPAWLLEKALNRSTDLR